MAVKARWPTPRPAGESDPPVAEVNPYIRLNELIVAEGALWDRDITCAIRDRKDSCCSACPIAGQNARLEGLCSIGQEMERMATAIVVEQVATAS